MFRAARFSFRGCLAGVPADEKRFVSSAAFHPAIEGFVTADLSG